jgi:hypothetical protein
MLKVFARFGQAAVYAAIAALVGYFANSPPYTWFPEDRALIKLSLIHGGTRPECRKRTREELAELAPNMRRPLVCPRERLPLVVDVEIDGSTLYHAALPPSGLFSDGPSRAYEKFAVTPGHHRLEVKLRDTAREDGYDFEKAAEIDLKPLQNFAVDFRAETGGFLFR